MAEKMARRNVKKRNNASSTQQLEDMPRCKLDFKTLPKRDDDEDDLGAPTDVAGGGGGGGVATTVDFYNSNSDNNNNYK